MENKYNDLILSLIKEHPKYTGYEAILEDIFNDVYSRSKVVLSTVTNEDVVVSYLKKVINSSIVTVPKKLNFNVRARHRVISTLPEISLKKEELKKKIKEEPVVEQNTTNVSFENIEAKEHIESVVLEEDCLELDETVVSEAEFIEDDKQEDVVNADVIVFEEEDNIDDSDELVLEEDVNIDSKNVDCITEGVDNVEKLNLIAEEPLINVDKNLVDKMINGVSPSFEVEDATSTDSVEIISESTGNELDVLVSELDEFIVEESINADDVVELEGLATEIDDNLQVDDCEVNDIVEETVGEKNVEIEEDVSLEEESIIKADVVDLVAQEEYSESLSTDALVDESTLLLEESQDLQDEIVEELGLIEEEVGLLEDDSIEENLVEEVDVEESENLTIDSSDEEPTFILEENQEFIDETVEELDLAGEETISLDEEDSSVDVLLEESSDLIDETSIEENLLVEDAPVEFGFVESTEEGLLETEDLNVVDDVVDDLEVVEYEDGLLDSKVASEANVSTVDVPFESAISYDCFSFEPDNVEVYADLIFDELKVLANKHPQKKIFEVCDLKYKKCLSVSEIAEKLGFTQDNVVDILNDIIEIVKD